MAYDPEVTEDERERWVEALCKRLVGTPGEFDTALALYQESGLLGGKDDDTGKEGANIECPSIS